MPTAAAAGAILTVDLGAIADNYRTLKRRLAPGADCAAVVKADAYGLGAAAVAPALAAAGCEIFFVAHVDEGISLRAVLGPAATIYVLNGPAPGAEKECLSAALRPVLNSLAQIAAWRRTARRAGRRLAAALQVDTGMSRLGLPPEEAVHLAAEPDALDGIAPVLVMSHLACADAPDHAANQRQRKAFEEFRRRLPPTPASLANSSGIFLGAAYHYDLARPGAALYGLNPIPGAENPMRPVVGVAAKIIQTRELGPGAAVGYGHDFRAEAPLTAATVGLGYGDGWPRQAASAAYFGDVPLRVLGRVSMDSIVLDISSLAPGTLAPGGLVELIGPHQSLDDVAAASGTIGYEILTRLGHRFHRRYVAAA